TKHAAGSQLEGKENFQDLFGILFPATGGIFAGAYMSGDLKNPSKSIPRGTLYGLALTFFSYTLVILSMAGSITRVSFYNDVDINRIASFITMTYLMTFFVTNLACFLLKLSSAPNFRPSFHYFNSWTAAAGAAASVAAMFVVDGLYATGSIGILVVIFLLIHYT